MVLTGTDAQIVRPYNRYTSRFDYYFDHTLICA